MNTLVIIALAASVVSLAAGILKAIKAHSTQHLRTFSVRIIDDQGNEFTSFSVNPEETHHAGKELKKVIRELSSEVVPEGSQAARIP